MSKDKRLSGSIALTKLVHVRMKKKGKGGKEIDGLFIPIDLNILERVTLKDGTEAVYMPVNVFVKSEQDERGQNGFISKTVDTKTWKAMSDEDKESSKEKSPIMGNIKDFSQSTSGDDAAGAASGETFDENDDLPF